MRLWGCGRSRTPACDTCPYSPQHLVGCQETPTSGAHPRSATASPPRGRPLRRPDGAAARVPQAVPNARFTFASGPQAQRGTFKGVWLNAERTEWALEKEQQ